MYFYLMIYYKGGLAQLEWVKTSIEGLRGVTIHKNDPLTSLYKTLVDVFGEVIFAEGEVTFDAVSGSMSKDWKALEPK